VFVRLIRSSFSSTIISPLYIFSMLSVWFVFSSVTSTTPFKRRENPDTVQFDLTVDSGVNEYLNPFNDG
jgi:hypothetical protein